MTLVSIHALMALLATNATVTMKSFLSVSEIAKITQKERSTIVRWITAGKFGNVRKVGNEYQVTHEKFRKWWNKNMKGGVTA